MPSLLAVLEILKRLTRKTSSMVCFFHLGQDGPGAVQGDGGGIAHGQPHQVAGTDQAGGREIGGMPDDSFQLPHISGPVVGRESSLGLAGEAQFRFGTRGAGKFHDPLGPGERYPPAVPAEPVRGWFAVRGRPRSSWIRECPRSGWSSGTWAPMMTRRSRLTVLSPSILLSRLVLIRPRNRFLRTGEGIFQAGEVDGSPLGPFQAAGLAVRTFFPRACFPSGRRSVEGGLCFLWPRNQGPQRVLLFWGWNCEWLGRPACGPCPARPGAGPGNFHRPASITLFRSSLAGLETPTRSSILKQAPLSANRLTIFMTWPISRKKTISPSIRPKLSVIGFQGVEQVGPSGEGL